MESVDLDSLKDSRLATSMHYLAGLPSCVIDDRLVKVAYRIEGVPTKNSIGETMALLGGKIVGQPILQIDVLYEIDESCAGHDLVVEPIRMVQLRD